MNFLNKNSPEIKKYNSKQMTATFYKDRIYFAKNACDAIGIRPGKYLHVIPNKNEWIILVNDDASGFYVTKDGPDKSGLKVCCTPLVRMFQSTTRFKNLPVKFFIGKCDGKEFQGQTLWEILINKSIDELTEA